MAQEEIRPVESLQDIADILMDMNIRIEKQYIDLTNIIINYTRSMNRKFTAISKRVGVLESDVKLIKEKLELE